ncbi:hypothetical protein OIU77_007046 [Salix suchowensis]|uniref:Uncharacterized protein n=1 Tax=Salix suchowensis TaxID=1278906 RepID=A0ABQ9AMS6_9ROSI|nr:hypothetical protein OIU77_007046 [Salix suchowensis]
MVSNKAFVITYQPKEHKNIIFQNILSKPRLPLLNGIENTQNQNKTSISILIETKALKFALSSKQRDTQFNCCQNKEIPSSTIVKNKGIYDKTHLNSS